MIESVLGAVAQSVKPLNKGVPGVPLHSLDAISDDNTRQVLRAIVDGWHMRNGASGDGDNRFITSRELNAVAGRVGGLSDQLSQTRSLLASFEPLGPGRINQLISDLHTQVFESRLFKALEERVDLVDKPGGIFERLGAAETTLVNEVSARTEGDTALATSINTLGTRIEDAETILTNEAKLRSEGDTALAESFSALGARVGDAETAITNEATARANADNAITKSVTTQFASVNESLSVVQTSVSTLSNSVSSLSTTISTVQAGVGDVSVAVATETEARVNADNTLYAQYTVKIDANGYVSGFGLASTTNNADPSSDFIVRADRFSIVSPTGNRAALIMTNNTINVFDENGNLRVKIGRLA